MRNRQIKKILIDKASTVDIPNVVDQIKARFNEIPPKPVMTQTYRRPLVLVSALTLSMLVLFAVAFGLVYGFRDVDPLASSDESLHDAVMLSSISTLSLIDDIDASTIETLSATLLSNRPNHDEEDEDTTVSTSVEGLKKYLFMMETVLKSQNNYEYQRKVISRAQRRYQLQFQTSSLIDNESNYALVYEVKNDSNEAVEMTLTMYGYSETYHSYITYQKRTGVINMTTAINDDQSVRVSYSEDTSGKHYQITTFENLMITEQVQMNFTSHAQVDMSFMKGNVFGTYSFSLTVDEKGYKRVILVDYDIQNQFQGQIEVFVTGTNNDAYTMIVKPNGKPSFVITGERHRGRN